MTLKFRCRICGDINETNHSGRKICDKPECQEKKHSRARTVVAYCEVCGKEIPFGSGKSKYCSTECREVYNKTQWASYDRHRPKQTVDKSEYPNCPRCNTTENVVKNGSNRYSREQRWKCKECGSSWHVEGVMISEKPTRRVYVMKEGVGATS